MVHRLSHRNFFELTLKSYAFRLGEFNKSARVFLYFALESCIFRQSYTTKAFAISVSNLWKRTLVQSIWLKQWFLILLLSSSNAICLPLFPLSSRPAKALTKYQGDLTSFALVLHTECNRDGFDGQAFWTPVLLPYSNSAFLIRCM